MEHYIANIVAETRRDDFTREASTARLARLVRRTKIRKSQPDPKQLRVVRPVVA
jgi:hypothetical protein